MAPPRPRRDRRWWTLRLLLVPVLVVASWVPEITANSASRLAFSAAVWDEGTVHLDDYADVTHPYDRIDDGEHLYLDKAPGQPVLGVPVYGLGRALGMEPASVPRFQGNLAMWWQVLWLSLLPGLGLVLLVRRVAERFAPDVAPAAALLTVCGTLLAAYLGDLFGHVLAALAVFAGWAVASSSGAEERPPRLALAGLLCGAGVLVDLHVVLVVAVVGIGVAVRARARTAWFVLGGVPAAAALAAYQWAVFGDPLTTSYSLKPVHASDPVLARAPDPVQLLEVLFGLRGLLVYSPVLAMGLWCTWRVLRHPVAAEGAGPGAVDGLDGRDLRHHLWVGVGAFVVLVLLQAGWETPYGGDEPGPRYVVAAIPFLAVPIALALERSWRITALLGVFGAVLMAMPTVTYHLISERATFLAGYLVNLRDRGLSANVAEMLLGPLGWLAVACSLGAAAVLFAQVLREARPADRSP